MSEVVAALAAATRSLADGDREPALEAILVAWRLVRHPRLANLVDYVSDRLLAGQPPIKGKTLAARMVAWHELAAKRDPATLARLLATAWPKTWQKAVPVVTPLLGWPHDPRFASAMVKIVEDWPFDVWRASTFYYPVFDLIDRQSDLRVLPRLRRQLEIERSDAYQQSVRARLVRAVEQLERAFPDEAPPALAADVEAALANVEAYFREQIDGVVSHREAEIDHLTAIYADPDDDAARAVYADWLGERGDPRGELITLQLAAAHGTASEAAQTRERKLIEEHGKPWAGSLERYFTDYEFNRGFFAGGSLRWRSRRERTQTIGEIAGDPAWALVTELSASSDDPLLLELVDRPELRSLRCVSTSYAIATQLAGGPVRKLTALHYKTGYEVVAPLASPLASCESLPALREIGFAGSVDGHVEWATRAPVVERLAKISTGDVEPRYLTAFAARAGTLRELEIDVVGRHNKWRARFQRERAPGPFTRLIVEPSGQHTLERLAWLLNKVRHESVRELVITTPKKLELAADARAELAAAIEKFGQLERLALPWPDLLAAPRAVAVAATGPRLEIRVNGETLFAPDKIEAVWRMTNDELGLGFDSFKVGSKWRSLGDDPIARLKTWAGNARCHDVDVYRDGAPNRLRLSRARWESRTSGVLFDLVLGERSYEDFIAWFLRFLELGVFDNGEVHLGGTERHRDAFDLRDLGTYVAGWLVYFARTHKDLVPVAGVEALGLAAYPTSTGVLVALARTPEQLTSERAIAAATGLRRLILAQLIVRSGFSLEERVHDIVGPVVAQLGLAHFSNPAQPFVVRYAASDGRGLTIHMYQPVESPTITAELQASIGFHRLLGSRPAGTRAEIDAALATVVNAVNERAAEFYDSPAAKKWR